jgi:cobaltochelatase CobN
MHRLAVTPGGWEAGIGNEGVVIIDQTPASLVVLTAADTDIQTLSQARQKLPETFPSLRVCNLLQLQQQLTIDTYADSVLRHSQGLVIRLLGGCAYWSYGLEVVHELVAQSRHTSSPITCILLPGDDRPDLELMSRSTVPLTEVETLWRYFSMGGVENYRRGLLYLHALITRGEEVPLPAQPVAQVGSYHWQPASAAQPSCSKPEQRPRVGILFYRAHYLSGNLAPIDALCEALSTAGCEPVPVFTPSLQGEEEQRQVAELLQQSGRLALLINTMSFSAAKINAAQLNLSLWQKLDIPVLQGICSGNTVSQWRSHALGLSPRDMAMNVVLPEVDGRVIGRVISGKAVQHFDPHLETQVVQYEPIDDRIAFMAELAINWIRLQQTPAPQRRIGLILANYPTRDGRLANGVGLDTPASCVNILRSLQAAGYLLSQVPEHGDDLIYQLTSGITNDPEGRELRSCHQALSLTDYNAFFETLPQTVQAAMLSQWGTPDQYATEGWFGIAGIRLGNIFVGIQPARGYDLDPSLNYHAPDLVPTHGYLAFYCWLRQHFQVHAVVHVGKHGNLEWLPGKGVALSADCFPEVALGPLPHFYPFIVNDPGEGTQAKRRAQAVILDHLTPPLTRAELYGPLQKLEGLIDEYYEAQVLDPTRLATIRDRILTLVQETKLNQDLGIELDTPSDIIESFLAQADGYLCELKEAQIRDGLHIFGECPQGRQLRDLLVSLARYPGVNKTGLTQALSIDWQLGFDPLSADAADLLEAEDRERILERTRKEYPALRLVGDAIAVLEECAANHVEAFLSHQNSNAPFHTTQVLDWIREILYPALKETDQEIENLLRGLEGRYVPSGPSGAPTRGRPDVLPTGRNFYSVDIRGLPTETAWSLGQNAAEALIERYTQDNGEYPRTLGLSLWGTATMRTGGDDIAEALALLGVRPVWEGISRRVVDIEVIPLSVLGRPRVDVTLRVSGFFRDAFANLIELFDKAVQRVAALDEPPDQNPLAAQVQQETTQWLAAGVSAEEAQRRSRYRVFGSKPGAYGAGLQGLIESQNWQSDADLAAAYIQWSCYAYSAETLNQYQSNNQEEVSSGAFSPEAFQQRLGELQIVLHNQDNREHDLLDSDDYYQFQGGLTAAVRSIQGENPTIYFGDHSRPAAPKILGLKEELAKVYRSRVINPKWIEGVMRHGYKGAFEMAATVDYLFAYDATTHCIEDHMYQGIAEHYLFAPEVQAFIQAKNPWALRDMAERLLEAHQRRLWTDVTPQMIDNLRALTHQAEAVIEGMSENLLPKS